MVGLPGGQNELYWMVSKPITVNDDAIMEN